MKIEAPKVKKTEDFREFLATGHAEQYTGVGDNMPNDYDDWLMSQDIEDIIDWAEIWHKKQMPLLQQ